MTNSEINRAIAERVMGWSTVSDNGETIVVLDSSVKVRRDWNPAESIADAMEAWSTANLRGKHMHMRVQFHTNGECSIWDKYDDDEPLCVCPFEQAPREMMLALLAATETPR